MSHRRGAFGLGAAHALALAASAGAAAVYARWLDPLVFGHWAAALALARAALLVVDGGLKTALVRRDSWPDRHAMRRVRRASAGVAVLAAAVVALGALAAWQAGRLGGADAVLYASYAAAYLLGHAASFAAAAGLERCGRFGLVAQAEGFSLLAEFTAPAALMAGGAPPHVAFVAAVLAARAWRARWLVSAARVALRPVSLAERGADGRGLWREGAGVLAVTAFSMLRDQMHLWLLAPWFGAAWAGQYGMALTACALLTQVPVQTAARLALPALRAAPPSRRWPAVLARVRRLAIVLLPALPLLPAVFGAADRALWQGRWEAAVALLPWFALRMVAGVSTTPLGSWLLVARPPWAAAGAHAAWTAVEIGAAVMALWMFGAPGLAIAAAIAAWPGVALLLSAASPGRPWWPRLRVLLALLLLRPSLAAGLTLGLAAALRPAWLPGVVALWPLAWLAEPRVRRRLASTMRRTFGSRPAALPAGRTKARHA